MIFLLIIIPFLFVLFLIFIAVLFVVETGKFVYGLPFGIIIIFFLIFYTLYVRGRPDTEPPFIV